MKYFKRNLLVASVSLTMLVSTFSYAADLADNATGNSIANSSYSLVNSSYNLGKDVIATAITFAMLPVEITLKTILGSFL